MPKRALGETFEQLKTTAGQVMKKLTAEPGEVAAEVGKQVTGQTPASKPLSQLSPEELAAEEKKRQEKARTRAREIEEELARARKQRATQPPPEPAAEEKKKILQLEHKKKKPVELPPSAKARLGTAERRKVKY